MSDRIITVRLAPLQDAWLTAIADVRNTTRSEVLREAITRLAARESDRVARSHHYHVLGVIARQESWNPVDDYLRKSDQLARDDVDL